MGRLREVRECERSYGERVSCSLMGHSFYDIEESSHFLCLCGIGTACSRYKTILLHVFHDGSLNNNGSDVFCRLLLQGSEMHRTVLNGVNLVMVGHGVFGCSTLQ